MLGQIHSLEIEFSNYCHSDVDIHKPCPLQYLEPNEGEPQRIQAHLRLAEKGITVVTGSERPLFDVLFSDEETCDGVVVVDINSKIIAYVDLNTLLLRISQTKEEYTALSQTIESPAELKTRIEIIRDKMEYAGLPECVHNYYQKHLDDYAFVYLTQKQEWRTKKAFEKCFYHENDEQFEKLRRYAQSGNIISVLGDINTLTFLQGRVIAVVDASNIHDYCRIDLKMGENAQVIPRLIFTRLLIQEDRAEYYSLAYDGLTKDEMQEFTELLNVVKSCTLIGIEAEWMLKNLRAENDFLYNKDALKFDANCGAITTRTTLAQLRAYVAENIICIPDVITVNMKECQLFNPTPEQIEALIADDRITKHFDQMVASWQTLPPATYIAFMHVEGWKEAFEAHFTFIDHPLKKFQKTLERAGMWDSFMREFGDERWQTLADTNQNRMVEMWKTKLSQLDTQVRERLYRQIYGLHRCPPRRPGYTDAQMGEMLALSNLKILNQVYY